MQNSIQPFCFWHFICFGAFFEGKTPPFFLPFSTKNQKGIDKRSIFYYNVGTVAYGVAEKKARFLHLCQRPRGKAKQSLRLYHLQLNRCTHLAVLIGVSFFFGALAPKDALRRKPFRNRFPKGFFSGCGNSMLQPISNSDAPKDGTVSLLPIYREGTFVDQDRSVKTLCGGCC